ncbi:MAG: C40 family peptidase [Sulfuriflexus sp.]|nr:C40 family peptidase [Sulfuriflexus sp.]
MIFSTFRHYIPLFLVLLFSACSSQPTYVNDNPRATSPRHQADSSQQVLNFALQQQGVAYRYGGSRPATGFDCSGLIQFSYGQVGKRIPRTTRAQYQSSRAIPLSKIRPGDLLFYETEGRRPGHVALYLGRGEMIHAPSSGKHVRISRLNNPYWRTRLLAAGRF